MKLTRYSLSLVTLSLLAACSGHKHKDSQAGSGGESPVSVKFTQSQGAALADINNRIDFGGQVAISSYSVTLACPPGPSAHIYTLKGGRMLVRGGESGCVSTLTDIVVTDQHGLTATFQNSALDSLSSSHSLPALENQYPNLHLDISGGEQAVSGIDDGTSVAYTYTLRDSTQGNNTTGTNDGDTSTPTTVSFAGVPLPDVSLNLASAWAEIDQNGTTGSFHASIQALSAQPCGDNADYAVELYAQTGQYTTKLAAHSDPTQAADAAAPYTLVTDDASLISDCRGLTTNLYLKLSCTSKNAIDGTLGKTSFKLVSIQSPVPNSPYTDIGNAVSYRCVNAAFGLVDNAGGLDKLRQDLLTADAAKDHPGTFLAPAPVVTESSNLVSVTGSDVHITTDGSAPTCASTPFDTSVKITLTAATTISTVNAISCPAGRPASAVFSKAVAYTQPWQDVTTVNGGSTHVACGLNTCIYKDNVAGSTIQGLQVTGILSGSGSTTLTTGPATFKWAGAVSACARSQYGGYPVNTWRLPTKDELVALSADGISSLAGQSQISNFLSIANTSNPFWSSDQTSQNTAYNVNLATGVTNSAGKGSGVNYTLCVK